MTAYTGWPATLLKVNTSTSEFSRFTIVQTLTILFFSFQANLLNQG